MISSNLKTKTSVPYVLDFDYDNAVDEYKIVFAPSSSLENLKAFLKLNTKDISIQVSSEEDAAKVIDFLLDHKDFKNWKICFNAADVSKEFAAGLKVNFYICDIVTKEEDIEELAGLGVSDVIVGGALTYQMKNTYTKCKELGLTVRFVIDNIVQDDALSIRDASYNYFVPQMIDKIAECADVIELVETDKVRLAALYNVWFIKKDFQSELQFIYPNNTIIPRVYYPTMMLASCRRKLNCGHACIDSNDCLFCFVSWKAQYKLHKLKIDAGKKE